MQGLPTSELRYRDIFENVPVGLFAVFLDGRILDANPAMVAILRYPSREQLLEANIADFQLDHADASRVLNRLRQDGEIIDLEVQLGRHDGTTVWLLTSARAARDDAGAVIYYHGAVEDITERKKAEQTARDAERRFQAFMDTMPVLAFIKDSDGRFQYANEACLRFLDKKPRELYGRTNHELLPVAVADPLRSLDLTVLHEHCGLQTIEMLPDQEGDAHTFMVLKFPIIDPSDRDFVGGFAVDITERRRAEEAERRLMIEQKKLQEQFHQAQKMEAIGRLAGGIAHDFNNLLTAIIGYNDLVWAGLEDSNPLRHNADEVRKAAERAARLTRQLLAVSRKQTLQPRVVDLNSSVAEIEKMLHRLLGDDIELSVVPSRESACVRADPSQLEQVLMNLAVNARDAMPSGGQLVIRISSVALDVTPKGEADLPPGRYIELRVTDTGIGMSEEVQARIFEPFFTTKEPGKGTGLGLATCYGIVKQSGGRILCETSPNRGTTFSIYLPQVTAEAQPVRPAPAAPVPRGTGTILLVEDADGVRTLAARVLRSLGYQLLEAENGFDALCIIDKHGMSGIDLILTDVTMPKMGGRELVERVRSEHPATRVLFTSGAPGVDSALRGLLSHPGTAFLLKPFTPGDLAQAVGGVIAHPARPQLNGSNGASRPTRAVALET
jgi:PAS domain S-box-containing protein